MLATNKRMNVSFVFIFLNVIWEIFNVICILTIENVVNHLLFLLFVELSVNRLVEAGEMTPQKAADGCFGNHRLFLFRILVPVIHQMRHDVVRQGAVPRLGAALGVHGVLGG